jgi:MATE family multidrug resistance protein
MTESSSSLTEGTATTAAAGAAEQQDQADCTEAESVSLESSKQAQSALSIQSFPVQRFWAHYLPLVTLAIPVMFTQAGHLIVQITDNILVGRLGAIPLAASSFAHNVFIGGLLFCIGFGMAMTPFVGAAFGKRDAVEAASWFKNGTVANLSLGAVLTAIMLCIGLLLDRMGQEPDVVRLARPVYVLWTLSILPTMMFVSFKQFAEGLGNTRVAAFITIQEIVLNVGLNYVLIYGKLGFPALGVVGSGWATLIARLSMPLTFGVLLWRIPFFTAYLSHLRDVPIEWEKLKRYGRLGVPLAGQTILEVAAFALGAIMMGWLSARELAAHQIAIGLASLTFMGATGIAAAATIKVSQYRGAADRVNMSHAAFAAMQIVLIYEALTALAFVMFRFELPKLYITDPTVIVLAANLLLIAAVFQLVDGLQVVALASLRGIADAKIPTLIAFAAYVVCALPTSYACAFVLGWRGSGIWTGYVIGLLVASVAFAVRFALRSKTVYLGGGSAGDTVAR